MRHDYTHPPDWDAYTDAEKCRWYTLERVRRQALRQGNVVACELERQRQRAIERQARRHRTTDVERHR